MRVNKVFLLRRKSQRLPNAIYTLKSAFGRLQRTSRVRILLNRDFSTRIINKGYYQIWTGYGLTKPEDFKLGWRVVDYDNTHYLNGKNVYLDTRFDHEAVKY